MGTFNFTVKLTDNVGANLTKPLAITVVSPSLSITTAALPDGTVGAAYLQTLAASGGTPPYNWSITWGALPDGLNLSAAGVVSGTPTNAGTFSCIIRVADSTVAVAQQIYTIEIAHSAPALTVVQSTGGAFQLRVAGDTGANYEIDASTNLMDWISVFTTNAAATPFTWNDTPAGQPATFYRVLLQP